MSQKRKISTCYRVRHSWEYRKIQHTGRKIKFKNFIVLQRNKEEGPVRLGLIVSRKVGGAVQRNRVKRLVREFFRHNRENFPQHWDIVVIAKRGAHQLSCQAVAGELSGLFHSKSLNPEGGKCLPNS